MNGKQRKTLAAIGETPTRSDIRWAEIESLLRALGAEMSEGRGSRLRIRLNETRFVVHRPHPEPTAAKAAVETVRLKIEQSGVLDA